MKINKQKLKEAQARILNLQKKAEYKQQSFGFKEETLLNSVASRAKYKLQLFGKKLHYSGVYTNFWLWNFIFLNVTALFIIWQMFREKYAVLQDSIGLNLDSFNGFDYVLAKEWLYLILVPHILLVILAMVFVYKNGKKADEVSIITFIYSAIFIFFELYGLNALLNFFVKI